MHELLKISVAVRLVLYLQLFLVLAATNAGDYAGDGTEVELRAVFINCDPNDGPDSETTRFEREELFRHSILRDCSKKLAFTVKTASEPDKTYGDEYIPIDHVLDGPKKSRIRLLNPYILRLRRETPLQAYKLRNIDTVSGILTHTNDLEFNSDDQRKMTHQLGELRIHEDSPQFIRLQAADGENDRNSNKRNIKPFYDTSPQRFKNWETCRNVNNSNRDKRHVKNIVVEKGFDDKNADHISKSRFYERKFPKENIRSALEDVPPNRIDDEDNLRSVHRNNKKELTQKDRSRLPHSEVHRVSHRSDSTSNENGHTVGISQIKHTKIKPDIRESKRNEIIDSSSAYKNQDDELHKENKIDATEKDFAVFEIGNPDVWYTAHLQLYEKLTTAEGKTVWNDMTKGEIASVSSLSSEWTGQDMNVRYQPSEWLPREEFTLPLTSLCLLAPIRPSDADASPEIGSSLSDEYIVVPADDIVGLEDVNLNKRDSNLSDSQFTPTKNVKGHRRVKVRVTRALIGGTEDKLSVVSHGMDRFLTIPHRRPHHAQVEVEARADDNQIVRVGASGRITTAVADGTRRTRTILLIQATNTGLAAARFRAAARDCGPLPSGLANNKERDATITDSVMIAPRHTRRLQLELPIEIPADIAYCSVALLNDDDESVAVRDVVLKKGDRCFCVWHCECVCLSDDSKLLCREMQEAQQVAAGLALRNKARHTRSVCYKDVVTVNCFIIVIGVIMTLLLLGVCKAFLGLLFPCIRAWGLDCILQTPRKLDHYYESSLCSRPVEYDADGWPIHPDTKKRTVHLVSLPMEFILNVIFFVTAPCLIICETVKQTIARFKDSKSTCDSKPDTRNYKKCFSSHDMQSAVPRWRKRRGGLRRWMTPQAEDLSADIWHKGLSPQPRAACETRPLLYDERYRGGTACGLGVPDSYADSEQDDTEYVLMQMQKSKESLARSPRKLNDSGRSSANTQWKREGVSQSNKK